MTGVGYPAETSVEWPQWSTTVRVVVRDPAALGPARHAVEAELAGMDAVANRFSPESEVRRVVERAGRPTEISPLLAETIEAALRVAEATEGAVDPTLGGQLVALGYDADLDVVNARATRGRTTAVSRLARRASWKDVRIEGDVLTVPPGVLLDLGATGKALAVDRAAERASAAAGSEVLVSVGGDLRIVGTLPGRPWRIEVAEQPTGPGAAWVDVTAGAVATSTTLARRWRSGGTWAHHVLDPASGLPVREHWRTATVAAATCVDANAGSTAALVLGVRAEAWLRTQGLPSRLVRADGVVRTVADWPEREAA